jgi:hypothetical protein
MLAAGRLPSCTMHACLAAQLVVIDMLAQSQQWQQQPLHVGGWALAILRSAGNAISKVSRPKQLEYATRDTPDTADAALCASILRPAAQHVDIKQSHYSVTCRTCLASGFGLKVTTKVLIDLDSAARQNARAASTPLYAGPAWRSGWVCVCRTVHVLLSMPHLLGTHPYLNQHCNTW